MADMLYLCGPMRGQPLMGFPAFDIASERLRKAGWSVVSPADLDRAAGLSPPVDGESLDKETLKECILRDAHALAECDTIALLEGWEHSAGTRVEIALAHFLGMDILDAETMYPIPEEKLQEVLPCLR